MSYEPETPDTVEVTIPSASSFLEGTLTIPSGMVGLVIFAHGSGSSRFSPRNQQVSRILNASKIATLLFDLLTPEEDADYQNRFNIELLTFRLTNAIDWAMTNPRLPKHLPIGLFGASTGAAAALRAARLMGGSIAAVVSRGGRPDLARDALPDVRSPSLFIVGGRDLEVEQLNREAMQQMRCENHLSIIPGATHLFEEGRSLDVAAELAAGWFLQHFQQRSHEVHPPSTEPLTGGMH